MAKQSSSIFLSPYLYLFIADHALLIYAAYYAYVNGGGWAGLAAVLAVPLLSELGGLNLIPRARPLSLVALTFLLFLIITRIEILPVFLFLLLLVRLLSQISKQVMAGVSPPGLVGLSFFRGWGAPLVYLLSTLLLYLSPTLQYHLISLVYLAATLLCARAGYLYYQKPARVKSQAALKEKNQSGLLYTAITHGAASGFLILLGFQFFPVGEISVRLGGFFLAFFLFLFYLGTLLKKYLAKIKGEKLLYPVCNYLPGILLLGPVFSEGFWLWLGVLGLSGFLLGLQESLFFSGVALKNQNYPGLSQKLQEGMRTAFFLSLLLNGWYLALGFKVYWLFLFYAFLLLTGGIVEADRYLKNGPAPQEE